MTDFHRDRARTSGLLGLVLLSVGIALPFCISGCGGGGNSAPVIEAEPEKTPEELAAIQREAHLKELEKQIKMAEKLYDERKADFAANLPDFQTNFESIKYGARGTKFEQKAQSLVDRLDKDRRDWIAAQFEKALTQIDELQEQTHYDEAEQELTEWGTRIALDHYFQDTATYKKYEEKIEDLRIAFDAGQDARVVLEKARSYKGQGDLAKAIGLLVAFPDKYNKTPFYAEVQETIAAYLEDYKVIADQRAEEAKIPFVDVAIDEYMSEFSAADAGDTKTWTVVDGVIHGENTSAEANGILTLSESDWRHYTVEFELKYTTTDEPIRLGVTAGKQPFQQQATFAFYQLHDLAEDEWIPFRVEVKEGFVYIHENSSGAWNLISDSRKEFPSGGIAFWLKPGQTLDLKSFRIKVTEKVAPEEEAKPEPEEGGK